MLTACSSVPQQSVTLSTEIGDGIKKQHQAEISLVNIFFEAKRKELDAALQRAIRTYFDKITPSGSITLTSAQLTDAATDILALNEKNNTAKESLEATRVALVEQITNNYLTLNQANSAITGVLQSVAAVKEAQNNSFSIISKETNSKVDLKKIINEINDFTIKGGQEAGKAINLIEKTKILNSPTNK